MDILDIFKEKPVESTPERKILDNGLLSVSDAVFEASLHRAGVEQDDIEWRLKEAVDTRAEVIKWYESRNTK